MAIVYPHVDGQAYTEPDRGRYQGNWQTEVMSPVLTATETVAVSKYGVVDGQGRLSSYFVSTARTAAGALPGPVVYSRGATGLVATIVVTAITASPSVVFTIQGYDAAAASWTTILTSAAIVGTGTTVLTISPGVTVTANVSVATVVPDSVRIVATHGDTDSITYSVGLDWIV